MLLLGSAKAQNQSCMEMSTAQGPDEAIRKSFAYAPSPSTDYAVWTLNKSYAGHWQENGITYAAYNINTHPSPASLEQLRCDVVTAFRLSSVKLQPVEGVDLGTVQRVWALAYRAESEGIISMVQLTFFDPRTNKVWITFKDKKSVSKFIEILKENDLIISNVKIEQGEMNQR